MPRLENTIDERKQFARNGDNSRHVQSNPQDGATSFGDVGQVVNRSARQMVTGVETREGAQLAYIGKLSNGPELCQEFASRQVTHTRNGAEQFTLALEVSNGLPGLSNVLLQQSQLGTQMLSDRRRWLASPLRHLHRHPPSWATMYASSSRSRLASDIVRPSPCPVYDPMRFSFPSSFPLWAG
jgi:hypothetical protein